MAAAAAHTGRARADFRLNEEAVKTKGVGEPHISLTKNGVKN
jgi:hypothetical protein